MENTTKRLYRSNKQKIIGGVCGGIAEYFNIDPVLVRLIFVFIMFTGGWALLAYIIGWIIVPKECIAKHAEYQEDKNPEPKPENE